MLNPNLPSLACEPIRTSFTVPEVNIAPLAKLNEQYRLMASFSLTSSFAFRCFRILRNSRHDASRLFNTSETVTLSPHDGPTSCHVPYDSSEAVPEVSHFPRLVVHFEVRVLDHCTELDTFTCSQPTTSTTLLGKSPARCEPRGARALHCLDRNDFIFRPLQEAISSDIQIIDHALQLY